MVVHGDQRAKALGYFIFGATGTSQEVHELRLGSLGLGHRRSRENSAFSPGVALFPVQVSPGGKSLIKAQLLIDLRDFNRCFSNSSNRYIPVGLLEVLPQKINDRPPFYKGRDDLETMMASPSCSDWIRISEMLLGPVRKDFSFLPKHKANAYE